MDKTLAERLERLLTAVELILDFSDDDYVPNVAFARLQQTRDDYREAARAVREAVPELYVADWTGTYFVRLGEQWFRVYPQKMLTPQEFGELGSAPDFSIDGELPPEVLAELSKDARAEYAEAKSHRPPFSTQAESAARAVRRLRSSKGYLPLRERNHIAKLIESMAAATTQDQENGS